MKEFAKNKQVRAQYWDIKMNAGDTFYAFTTQWEKVLLVMEKENFILHLEMMSCF